MDSVNIFVKNRTMTVSICVDIDHHSSDVLRKRIDDELLAKNPKELIIDFSGVSFMDSSGIGLIMGRYKLAKSIGTVISICGLNSRCKKLLKLSSVTKFIPIKEIDNGRKQ